MSIDRRVSEDLRAFADITVTEGDIMNAQQQFHERITVATQRRNRTRIVAVATAFAAAAVGAWWLSQGDPQTGAPPVDQPRLLVPDQEAGAVASGFAEAYAAFDVPRADSFLTRESSLGLGTNWRQFNTYLEATGARLILDPCTEVTTTATETTMHCPFDYHVLRSDDLNRGPFGGSSFDLTVSDGRIVAASMNWDYTSNTFSSTMWEPFADWVSSEHPNAAAIMYADWPSTSLQRMTPAAIDLWSQLTREYVAQVLANRAAVAPQGPG